MRRFFAPAIILLLLGFGCAQIKPPPGGPEDTSPPKVIEVLPADSAVNVRLDTPIRILFDEYIQASASNIALSPPVEKFSVKVRHKSIEVDHSGLLPNTTYRVVISTALSDLRGNSLRKALSYAFSTGSQLDTLSIEGRIFDSEFSPSGGVRIHGYSKEDPEWDPQKTDPSAITWSGKDGRFALENLPEGNFAVVGILDENRDGFLSENELIALSPEDYGAGDDIPWSMLLFVPDSTPPELISSSAEGQYIVKIRFSEKIKLDGIDVSSKPDVGGFAPFIYPEEPQIVGLMAESPLPEGKIEFEVKGIADMRGNRGDYNSTVEIRETAPDTIPPSPAMNKKVRLLPEDSLLVRLDKPVRSGEVVVEDSLGREVAGSVSMSDPYSIVFTPENEWPSREDIEWRIEKIITLDGDTISDSTRHELRFESAQGYGNLMVNIADVCENLIVRAVMLDTERREFSLTATESGFSASSIPRGQYSIYLFCDFDGDSRWFPGSISPLKVPEPIFIYPDTIDVRGFWTTEVNIGIE